MLQPLEVRDPERLAFVTQTTLSVDDTAEIVAALRARFPAAEGPARARTSATPPRIARMRSRSCWSVATYCWWWVRAASSNSNRLRELADRAGVPGYLIDGPAELKSEWFQGKQAIGVTAGASAPEILVQQVLKQLTEWGGQVPREIAGREENVYFALPRDLRRKSEKPV